ncbi:MAG TPA: UDP-glucose/GDP-mannose dehydrogenase family protein [Dehalococcoidia bacterium]|jgi:UDPglucose 6-dehydrogenase
MNPRKIAVVGTGYVGLVYAVCMADLGHDVVGIDIDESKIDRLSAGVSPIYEPGLDDLLRKNLDAGRLRFTTAYDVHDAEFIFLAVSTPSTPEGAADLKHVREAVQAIARNTNGNKPIIINKSTSPVGTGDTLDHLLTRNGNGAQVSGNGAHANGNDAHANGNGNGTPVKEFPIVANPEFLREGSAVHDFFHPDRIVLGARDKEAASAVAELYAPLNGQIVFTDVKTAEMIKYASNAFLATKISFINEIASICEGVGANVDDVARAMGLDERIGSKFLQPGLGFGGSCLPKDVRALAYLAQVYGAHPQMLTAVLQINAAQRRRVIRLLRDALGSLEDRVVTMLGLAFKPGTDDIREAPSVDLARLLVNEGAIVRVYDPVAMASFGNVFPDIAQFSDPLDAARGANALIIVTEWAEFASLPLDTLKETMATPLIGDCRNVLDRHAVRDAGFAYFGAGTGLSGLKHLVRQPEVHLGPAMVAS